MVVHHESDFSDLEGYYPQRNRRTCHTSSDYDEIASDRMRRIINWQRWIDERRDVVADALEQLTNTVDGLADDFLTQGVLDIPFADIDVQHPISFYIRSINMHVDFPCEDAVIHRILSAAIPAGFGRSGQNLVDQQVRSTLEVSASDLEFLHPFDRRRKGKGKGSTSFVRKYSSEIQGVQSYRTRIEAKGKGAGLIAGTGGEDVAILRDVMTSGDSSMLESIRRCLYPSMGTISAQLYKMLIYGVGDHFDTPHVDTARSQTHVGTLVISLPTLSSHQGGVLRVQHNGREESVDFSKPAIESLCGAPWAAFFASCTHRVQPLLAGFRITLIYNLSYSQVSSTVPAALEGVSGVSDVALALANVIAHPMLPRRPLGLLLKHEYPLASSWNHRGLKGADRSLLHAVQLLGLKWRLQPVILEHARHAFPWSSRQGSVRIYRSALPDVALYHRLIENIVGAYLTENIIARIEAFVCRPACLDELPDITLVAHSDLPLGVTWVTPPVRALGIALMDEEGGRYTGNEMGEQVLHYYHVAMLISTKQGVRKMIDSEFIKDHWSLEAQLAAAACAGDEDDALALLQQGANAQDGMCREAVARSVELGNTFLLQALFDHGALATATDRTGRSVLQLALGSGKADCVELLIFHGAQFDEAASETLMGHQGVLRAELEAAVLRGATARGDSKLVEALFASKQHQVTEMERAVLSAQRAYAYEQRRASHLVDAVRSLHARHTALSGPISPVQRALEREARQIRGWLRRHPGMADTPWPPFAFGAQRRKLLKLQRLASIEHQLESIPMRFAWDGQAYSFQEFVRWYGIDAAGEIWSASAPSEPQDATRH